MKAFKVLVRRLSAQTQMRMGCDRNQSATGGFRARKKWLRLYGNQIIARVHAETRPIADGAIDIIDVLRRSPWITPMRMRQLSYLADRGA